MQARVRTGTRSVSTGSAGVGQGCPSPPEEVWEDHQGCVCSLCPTKGLQGSMRALGLKMDREKGGGRKGCEEGATMIQRNKQESGIELQGSPNSPLSPSCWDSSGGKQLHLHHDSSHSTSVLWARGHSVPRLVTQAHPNKLRGERSYQQLLKPKSPSPQLLQACTGNFSQHRWMSNELEMLIWLKCLIHCTQTTPSLVWKLREKRREERAQAWYLHRAEH